MFDAQVFILLTKWHRNYLTIEYHIMVCGKNSRILSVSYFIFGNKRKYDSSFLIAADNSQKSLLWLPKVHKNSLLCYREVPFRGKEELLCVTGMDLTFQMCRFVCSSAPIPYLGLKVIIPDRAGFKIRRQLKSRFQKP